MPETYDFSWLNDLIYDNEFILNSTQKHTCKIEKQPTDFKGCVIMAPNEIRIRKSIYPCYDSCDNIIWVRGEHPSRDTILDIPPDILNKFIYTLKNHTYKVTLKGQVVLC